MRKNTAKLILVFFLCLSAPASAEVQERVIHFSPASGIMQEGEKVFLLGADSRLTASGGYELPYLIKSFKFPEGTVVGDLKIDQLLIKETELREPLSVLPPKPPVYGGKLTGPVSNILCGGDYYPDRWFRMEVRQGIDSETFEPTVFATVHIYPVRVKGVHVKYIESIDLFLPVEIPDFPESRDSAALLIIGPEEFLSATCVDEFVAHKLNAGIDTMTLSMEYIQENETGRDEAEKIKKAIETSYYGNDIRYVLLLGDVDRIPVRYTFHSDYGGSDDWENIPSDLYYADLFDGAGNFCDWDADGDDIFGEYENGNADQCDFLPDVLIGRIPAGTLSELEAATGKILHYEQSLAGEEAWLSRIVLAGADTFSYESHGETSGIPEGEATKEFIAEHHLNDYELIKLYETGTYERTAELTTESLFDAFEDGALYVNFANHGWIDGWSFEGGFTTSQVDELTNYETLPVTFGYACSTSVFDTENPECPVNGYDRCFGEAIILHPDGGAVGYYGATRTAFAGGYGMGGHLGAMGYLDEKYFQAIGAGHKTQGYAALSALSSLLLDKGLADTVDFITVLQFEYFGDPSLATGGAPESPDFHLIWSGIDDSANGDGDGCIEPGETIDFIMYLANDGAAAEGVEIEMTLVDPEITLLNASAVLNDMGRGTRKAISPLLCIDLSEDCPAGRSLPLDFRVSWTEGETSFSETLFIGEYPYLTAEKIWITGDDNNDNIASPGEEIKFAPAFHNIGCAAATGFTAQIEIDDQWVRNYGVRGNGTVADIHPGETFIPQRLFFAELAPMTPHQHMIECFITLTDEESRLEWQYELQIPVLDYTLPVVENFKVNPAEPEPGQTVFVTATVKDSSGVEIVQCTLRSYEIETPLTFSMYDDGEHGDGNEGDYIFGAEITLSSVPTYYQADMYVADTLGNKGTVPGAGGASTVPFVSNDSILIVPCADNDAYLGLFTQALLDAGYNFDVWSWYRGGMPPEAVLDEYTDGAVVWFYSHTFPMLEEQERDAIDYYLSKGGNLLITEQDLGWAMVDEGTPETQQWYENTLLAEYIKDSVPQKTVCGIPGNPVSVGLEFNIDGGSGAKNQQWPSLIEPIAPAQTCLTYKDYSGPQSGTAAIYAQRNGAKHVYLAFGFEGIASQKDRCDLMADIMNYFGLAPDEDYVGLPWNQSPGWWIGPELPLNSMYADAVFCPYDNRIYRAGGIPEDFAGGSADKSVVYIETSTGLSGDAGVDLLHDRFYHASACLFTPSGPKIFFIGGINFYSQLVNDVEAYDPLTGEISVWDDDPLPVGFQGIPGSWVTAQNKLYIIGEALLTPPYQRGKTWVFDPNAEPGERWTQLDADISPPRFFAATAYLDEKIFLIGGISQIDQDSIRVYDRVDVLDLSDSTPQWNDSAAQDLPKALFFAAGVGIAEGSNVLFENKILVAGGMMMNDDPSAYLYDLQTDSWSPYWPTKLPRMLHSNLLTAPGPRGPAVWMVGGYYELLYGNTAVLQLGPDPEGSWVNIRTFPDTVPDGGRLYIDMDIAGDDAAEPVDCFVAMEVFDEFYFLTADPAFPTFTEEPMSFFSSVPLTKDVVYSGPLLDLDVPPGIPLISGTFYAATVFSDSGELAGGLSWSDFTIGEE